MPNICAYAIAIESLEERASNARRLISTLTAASLFEEVSLHPAIYWKNRESVVDYLLRHPDHTFTESYLDECLMGQLAVTLSHVSAWRRLLASDHDGAVILEDDIQVTDMPLLRDIVSELKKGDAEWVRLHLFRKFRDGIVAAGRGRMFIADPQPWGFAAYYVSRAGAEKLLANCHDMAKPVDYLPPDLMAKGILAGKTVTRVAVDLEAFDGDVSELRGRSSLDTLPDNLQKIASTIFNSPRVAEDAGLRGVLSRLNHRNELQRDGFTVLRKVFRPPTIRGARKLVLDNRGLFKTTRPAASTGHLAGFHRFTHLESLHTLLTANVRIRALMDMLMEGDSACTIGLSDIAINRSQSWHVDLLRGKYARFLSPALVWGRGGGGAYKVMLYLNKAAELEVAKGSHRVPVTLENDEPVDPGEGVEVSRVEARAGDVVVMDLRCRYRCAEGAGHADGHRHADPGIVVSTVIGGAGRPLTKAMEFGNFLQLMERGSRVPPSLSIRTGRPADGSKRHESPGATAPGKRQVAGGGSSG